MMVCPLRSFTRILCEVEEEQLTLLVVGGPPKRIVFNLKQEQTLFTILVSSYSQPMS